MCMIICSCICVFFFFETRKVLFPEHHNEGKQTENKQGACSELSCLSWVLPALSKGAEKCFHRHEREIMCKINVMQEYWFCGKVKYIYIYEGKREISPKGASFCFPSDLGYMGNCVISSPTEWEKRSCEDRQFKVMAHPPTPTPWNHCNHLNLTVKWILGRKGHLLNIYTITTQLKHRILAYFLDGEYH